MSWFYEFTAKSKESAIEAINRYVDINMHFPQNAASLVIDQIRLVPESTYPHAIYVKTNGSFNGDSTGEFKNRAHFNNLTEVKMVPLL